jgi:hypothetical protein
MFRFRFALDDHRPWLARAAVAALVAYFVTVGCLGVDFGKHWDEWYHVEGLKHCVDTLTWFPQRQIYNGIYFLLGLPFVIAKALPFLPAILRDVASHSEHQSDIGKSPAIKEAQQAIVAFLDSHDYLLDIRRTFVCVTSLTIVWVYLTVRRMHPKHTTAALAAAAFVAFSWEAGYHARYIAVDGVVMQFLALELYAFCRAWRAPDASTLRRWTAVTAAAAAAAWAGKTTAIFAALPMIALVVRPEIAKTDRRRLVVTIAASYFATAFVLSPGAFIDPFRYLATMAVERHNYNDVVPLHPHLVDGWGLRLWRAVLWLIAVVPSPVVALAVPLSALAGVGVWSWLRREAVPAVWLAFCAAFLLFVTTNRQLIVRNCLIVVPFVAVSFGVGVAWLAGRRTRWRPAAVGFIVAAFAWNAVWGVRAAASIRHATPETVLETFRADRDKDRGRYRLSPKLAARLGEPWTTKAGCRPIAAVGNNTTAPDRVFLLHGEHLWNRFANNRPGALATVYGPLAANLDWYITFQGAMPEDRIIGVSHARADEMLLDMSRYRDCGP